MSHDYKPSVLMGNLDWNKVTLWSRFFRDVESGAEGGLDLNAPTAGFLSGVQGAGKSATLGTLIESFTTHIPNGNYLVDGLEGCALAFHYSDNMGYAAELTLSDKPNSNPKELELLKPWGITPTGIKKIKILCPVDQVELRKAEYPHLEVVPLLFNPNEISIQSYQQLLGDAESSSFAMERLMTLMKRLRGKMSPKALIEAIHHDPLLELGQKNMLQAKVEKAQEWISDSHQLIKVFEPGTLVIADMRDEFLDKRGAFRLLLVLLNVFADAKLSDGRRYPKILVADEAHEYAEDEFLVKSLIRRVRLMRHMGLTILIASQDSSSIHPKLREMCSWTIMLSQANRKWVQDLTDSISQVGLVNPDFYLGLPPGTAYVWSRQCTDAGYMARPQKVHIRVRASQHGGFSKTAVAA